jgi:fatty-acyl-CoA synthase
MYALDLTESYCPAQADQDLRESTVGSVLREAATRTPDAPALHEVDGDGLLARHWTYAELLADSERLAHALLTRYRPGERIAVWAPNIPEWVIAEFAFGLAGLVLVTVNPGYQPRELKYVLEQSRAVGLLLINEHRGNPMARIAAEVVADIPAIREVVNLDDHEALFREAGPLGSLPRVLPRDEVQIQYTSGTTGFPKGVVLHHHGITNNARHCMARMGLEPGATTMVLMPLFHTGGCGLAILGGVQIGSRMILVRQFDPFKANALIENERVQAANGVPTMLIDMLEADKVAPCDYSSVQLAGSGGSMVPPEIIRQVTERMQCGFSTVYGQTETSPLLTVTRPEDPLDDILHTVGQVMPQTELSIRDPATNQVVPVGTVGEICARAYSLMLGYNDDPEATAKTIDAEGWLHTGDLGTMDSRGFVRVTGRVKEMIIRGGENLFPAEIENVLLEHPDVAEVAVVGVPDQRFGEEVAAFVRVTEGASLDPGALIAHCRANIAAQKTPRHWIAVTEWPLTGSGKIQKFALRDQWVADTSGNRFAAQSSKSSKNRLTSPAWLDTPALA